MLQTFYQIDTINFQHNEGDYYICKSMEDVLKILLDVEHILDSEPNEPDTPYSILIKPIVMTYADYKKLIEEKYK